MTRTHPLHEINNATTIDNAARCEARRSVLDFQKGPARREPLWVKFPIPDLIRNSQSRIGIHAEIKRPKDTALNFDNQVVFTALDTRESVLPCLLVRC